MYPELHFGDVRLGSFNLFVGIGLVFWVCATLWQLKRLGIRGGKESLILSAMPVSLLAAVAIACLSDIVFRWRHFCTHPTGFGMTFYGGLMGFFIFWSLYAQWKGLDLSFLMNVFLPSVAVAQAFGRIGCFLGGCCYGMPVSSWGVVFPEGSPVFRQYGNCPVVPVQLYESAWLFLVGIVLFNVVRFRTRWMWYLILVGSGRFLFEFLRGDIRFDLGNGFPLSPAQCISALIVACGVWHALRKPSVNRTTNPKGCRFVV